MEPLKKSSVRKAVELTLEKRIRRVLVSQGKPANLANTLPEEVTAPLAELCAVDGTLDPETRLAAKAILDAYYDSQKAVVDGDQDNSGLMTEAIEGD